MFEQKNKTISKTCEQFVIESIYSQIEIIKSLEKTVSENRIYMQKNAENCHRMHKWRSKRKFTDSVTRIASRAINLAFATTLLYERSPIAIFSAVASGVLMTNKLLKNRMSSSISKKSNLIENVCAASCIVASVSTSSSPMSLASQAFACGFTSFVSGMSLYSDNCKHKIIKCEMSQEQSETFINSSMDKMKKSSKAVSNMISCDSSALSFVTNISNKQMEALDTILNRSE